MSVSAGQQRTLIKWLSENACIPTADNGKFDRIVARQITKGNKVGEEIHIWEVPESVSDDWFESAALEILTKLQVEAAALGGLQRSCLYAYFSDNADNYRSRHTIRIQGADDEVSGLDSEGPDKDGMTSQAMRHNEVLAKTFVGGQATLLQSYQQQVNRLSAMLERVQDKLFEKEIAYTQLLTERRADLLEERQMDLRQKSIDKVVESVGLLAPVIINKVAGQKLLPESVSGVLGEAKSLFKSLTPPQIEVMLKTMSPAQAAAFISIGEALTPEESVSAETNGAQTTQ